MWTMHDYPRYGDAIGYSVQLYHAFAICGQEMKDQYISNIENMLYEGHTKLFPKKNSKQERC